MSTRTEFKIAIWCHQDTFCGIMTPYNDIDLVQIGSGNEWLVAWRCQACSALSHYLNKLKGRRFETSWRPCYVTVKTMLQKAISILQMIKSPVRECGISSAISQGMLLNKQSCDWWLETWRSYGVTVITTPFRYYKWLRLQWESVEVSLVQVMACRLFGAKPLPEPVEGPVIWNVMTAMLRHCNNYATKRDFGITNDYISNERVWRFALLLARTCYWINSRTTGDWKHHDAHVVSL